MAGYKDRFSAVFGEQEQKAARTFIILFYISIIGYEVINVITSHQKSDILNQGLGIWLFVAYTLLLPISIYFLKINKPRPVKYILFYGFITVYSIHEAIIYSSDQMPYFTAHLFEIIVILFSPIFVNKRFFWIVSGTILTKLLIFFVVMQDPMVLFGVCITLLMGFVPYVTIRRFFDYLNTFEESYQTELELEGYKQIAYVDELTGIHNKRHLNIQMNELELAKDNLAIAMIDIDKFKTVNDSYNHNVGDQVLKHFVKVIQNHLSYNDIFARYGGEEFTVIFKNRSFDEVKELAEKIRQDIETSTSIVSYNGQKVEIDYTASFGLYYIEEGDKFTLGEAQVVADNLLYLSKKNGRNKVTANNIENRNLYDEGSYI